MMTLEQIGLLAILWCEAEEDLERRMIASPRLPDIRAGALESGRRRTLRAAIRHYKLLQEAKGKGANDGTV